MADTQALTDDSAGTFTLGGDIEVRRLAYGAMRITGDGVWGPPEDPEGAKRVLKRTVELGVNLIDTANSYGPDVSEHLIADALHPRSRSRPRAAWSAAGRAIGLPMGARMR